VARCADVRLLKPRLDATSRFLAERPAVRKAEVVRNAVVGSEAQHSVPRHSGLQLFVAEE
jgi:hypothetical protein